MSVLTTARFVVTAVEPSQLPRDGLPEVAFVGRSNAGKSTAINVLCNRRRLAFSSRTPGRTQALNCFAVGPPEQPIGYLIDTPGYGYAAAPLQVKRGWDQLAGQYLRQRQPLVGVVLLADVRRQLTELDLRLLDWVPASIPLAVGLVELVGFGQRDRQRALRDVLARLRELRGAAPTQALLFSATRRIGIEALVGTIEHWLVPADPVVTGGGGDAYDADEPSPEKPSERSDD